MTSKIKRFLSMALTVFMIMTMMPAAVLAEDEVDYVAKIGDKEFSTFAAAMTEANSMSGEVSVEIYGKVEYTSSTPNLTGSYDKISFVGKTSNAEISLTRNGDNGYISGDGNDCAVRFENLTLRKPEGGFSGDAAHMNCAFSVHRVGSVSYSGCVFSNGSATGTCATTYTGCTFYRSHDKYGLWATNGARVKVDNCKFVDYRGIKLWDEGDRTILTVEDSDFTKVTDKPAIVLTYGGQVTLSKNTYSSTGVFELDGAGANGTPVTSDVPPTCMNDDHLTVGSCGVLVDGKIYTTVADVKDIIQESSKVTLLYNPTISEDMSIVTNVALDLNGKKVTVAKNTDMTVKNVTNGSFVLEESATLTAPAGLNVTTNVSGCKVEYANGVYRVVRKTSYTVTFDPNGGEGVRTTQTFTEGETKALNENKFTRKNFYFTGWKDDEGNFYTNKQAVKFTKNTTLYAQWARVPSTTSYTVQYNANGGTGSVYLQAFTSSMTFNLRMNEFVREGYTFAGWNTKADGTGDSYAEGASFSGSIKKSIVLYAQWKLDVPEFPAVRPEYKIEVEGQEGKITRLNDTSIIYDEMYIRWSIGFETGNTTFAMIAMLDVTWVEGQEGIVGTFTIPVIETNGIISGVCYMVTTDDRANELTVGEAAENIYGILIV